MRFLAPSARFSCGLPGWGALRWLVYGDSQLAVRKVGANLQEKTYKMENQASQPPWIMCVQHTAHPAGRTE